MILAAFGPTPCFETNICAVLVLLGLCQELVHLFSLTDVQWIASLWLLLFHEVLSEVLQQQVVRTLSQLQQMHVSPVVDVLVGQTPLLVPNVVPRSDLKHVVFMAHHVPRRRDPPQIVTTALDTLSFNGEENGLYGSGHIFWEEFGFELIHVQPMLVPPLLIPSANSWYPSVHGILPPPSSPYLVHGLLLSIPIIFVFIPTGVHHGVPLSLCFP